MAKIIEVWHVYISSMHMDENLVEFGQKVKIGQPIGKVGVTGDGITSGIPHNHFYVAYKKSGSPSPPKNGMMVGYRKTSPHSYWLGINEFRQKHPKYWETGPNFEIPCYDPKVDYGKLLPSFEETNRTMLRIYRRRIVWPVSCEAPQAGVAKK